MLLDVQRITESTGRVHDSDVRVDIHDLGSVVRVHVRHTGPGQIVVIRRSE